MLDTLPEVTDPERLAELAATGLLDSAPEEPFDRITRLAQRLLRVRTAVISLVDQDRQFFKSGVGLDDQLAAERQTPLSRSFCQFVVTTGEPLVIDDAERSLLVRDNPAVVDGGVRTYAGVPLEAPSGRVLGTLCVFDDEARRWTDEEVETLRELTAMANSEIAYRLGNRQMADIAEGAERLGRAVDGLGDALRSMVDELSRHERAPRVDRAVTLAQLRLTEVEKAMGHLVRGVAAREGTTGSAFVSVDLRDRVKRAAHVASVSTGCAALRLDLGDAPVSATCDSQEIERALTQLLVSSLHHAEVASHVDVRLASVSGAAVLEVRCPGRPVPAAELARVVSRFHVATCENPLGEGSPSVRMSGGAVVAENGPIRAVSSRSGTTYALSFGSARTGDGIGTAR